MAFGLARIAVMPYGSLIMTFWQQFSAVVARIPDAVTCVFQCVVDVLRETLSPEARRGVAFTSAMIALSAKMAKADGVVTAIAAPQASGRPHPRTTSSLRKCVAQEMQGS